MATDTFSADFDDASAVRNFVGNISEQLQDNLDRAVGLKERTEGYFPPNSDWLAWQDSQLVVRLDVAVYALHLAYARMLFKPIVHEARVLLQKTVTTAVEVGVFAGSFAVLTGAIGFIFRILLDIANIWDTETEQRLIERSLRLSMNRVQVELPTLALQPKKRVRHRRKVASRHQTPKQRRANK